MASATVQIEYRRTVTWTIAVIAVYLLRAVGLKMPKRLLLWFARTPGQWRIAGGKWQMIRLHPEDIHRRFR